ncbi:hypothetical protein GPZ77_23480 [Streptomyces sp. QHH-9511]|nr:hypothetical protein GPZ77_23480 [Streptomyces sp. QHH-9511]
MTLPVLVGGDARVTGGLRRHGGNRPLPLHKVMDSGNKGYASLAERCRPGTPTSCKSHLTECFGAGNGGKQAWFCPLAGKRERGCSPFPGASLTISCPRPDHLHAERALPVRPYVNPAPGGCPEE